MAQSEDSAAEETTEETTEESGDESGEALETAQAEEPIIDTSASANQIPTSYQQYVQSMLDKQHKPFEFHGYMRAGYGISHKGTDNETVRPPTIFPQRWRLGNEDDNYVEATFVNNWLNPERDTDSAWFKTQLLITWITDESSNFAPTTVALREAFAEAGNVIESQPGLSFWAGQRYYRRHDIHVIDWFYLSNSGYGGGFQDLDLGLGKLHVALMGGSDPATEGDDGRAAKYGFDVRLTDLQVPGGTGTVWLWLTRASNAPMAEGGGIDPTLGIAAGFLHTRGDFFGGFNKFTVQVGNGPSSNFDTFGTVVAEQDALNVRVSETAQIQPTPEISAMATIAGEYLDNGNDGANEFKRTWITAGIRPIYHFTKYTSLAAELGYEYLNIAGTDDTGGDRDQSGSLLKFTLAPQVQTGAGFWARPSIRVYATAFYWTDGFSDDPDDPNDVPFGTAGGSAFAGDNFGAQFGVQAESWW